MAAYQIFIPNVIGADTERNLLAAGLSHIRAEGMTWYDVSNSPLGDGAGGTVGTWQKGDTESDPALGFHLDRQEWIPAKADEARELPAERFWIGYEPDRPVLPGNIMRKTIIPGSRVVLRDNNIWTIPIVNNLPHTHGLNDKGKFARKVSKEYEEFAQRGAGYLATIFAQIDADLARQMMGENVEARHEKIECEGSWEFVCNALNINYMICPEVVDAFDLIDDKTTVGIISAAIDLPLILDTIDQKKTPEPDHVAVPIGRST